MDVKVYTLNDLKMYYLECYIQLKEKNYNRVKYVSYIGYENDDSREWSLKLEGKPSGRIGDLIDKQKYYKFDDPLLNFEYPSLGYANLKQGYSAFLSKTIRKNYKKALCMKNVEVNFPFHRLPNSELGKIMPVWEILDGIFNRRFLNYEETLENLRKNNKTVSQAFSKQYCLAKRRDEEIFLFRKSFIIGKVDNNGKVKLTDLGNFYDTELLEIGVKL